MKSLLFCCLVTAWALLGCTTQGRKVHIEKEQKYSLVDGSFKFKCKLTSFDLFSRFHDLVVEVNGNTTTGEDRLTNRTISHREVEFTYNNTVPNDNGTTFKCVDENVHSSVLTMQVYYLIFTETTTPNDTIWTEQATNSSFNLTCTAASNPKLQSLTLVSITSHSNSTSQTNSTKGVFQFTKAQLTNMGNYSCIAKNKVLTSSITYNTFIGGRPTETVISDITIFYNSSGKFLQFKVTEKSPAPSRGVRINVKGLISIDIPFLTPIVGGPESIQCDVSKLDTPGLYNFSVTPYNDIGSGTPATKLNQFVYGKNFTIKINTTKTTVPQYSSFYVNCTSNNKYVNVSLFVNGKSSRGNSNVVQRFNKNGVASYVVKVTEPNQDQTTFNCTGSAGSVSYNTTEVKLTVLYAPVFKLCNNKTSMNEFAPQTSFNLNCTLQYPGNPPSKLQLERTSKEKNVRITTTKTSLTYEVQNATIKNRDNFTCIAVNTQGRTYSSNMVYVGGAPNHVKVTINPTVKDSEVYLDMQVVDTSDAPALNFTVSLPELKYNCTVKPVGLAPKQKQDYPGVLKKQLALFGKNKKFNVVVFAFNSIGKAVVYNSTMDIPVSPPPVRHSSKVPKPSKVPSPTPSPAAQILPPWGWGLIGLVIVVILVVVILGVVYYIRKKKSKDYILLGTADSGRNYNATN